jgi:GNAT superfamily N-acetyltransferase
MSVVFRRYACPAGITEDYYLLRAFFLRRLGDDFPFARWDWMITHGWLDHEAVGRIGIWEEGGEVVGVATFDTQPGEGFICVMPGYEGLRPEMVRYAAKELRKDGKFRLLVWDADPAFQQIAADEGFIPTPEKENDSVFLIRDAGSIRYALPEGFRVAGMDEAFDVEKYGQVLWRGFNHELKGEGPLDLSDRKRAQLTGEMVRPNVDLSLKIAVIAPNGDYVSYCGMWLDPASPDALVEPVATDPQYRKLGLGKAAVLEGVRRCGLRGARRALVGSCQQFYYSIGFRPLNTYTWWVESRR